MTRQIPAGELPGSCDRPGAGSAVVLADTASDEGGIGGVKCALRGGAVRGVTTAGGSDESLDGLAGRIFSAPTLSRTSDFANARSSID